ncbi:hypothetical protein ABB37_04332 [Leptomonas pyrrhocoris]|uniref:Uncharacterized protein n=1 Tax=Leptomonas pyrrhocoris TaxID=157538 RepID=A0A0M9G2Q3_LEPPY|nr:hypothetical protein ABB37_04332 [Leptomonas pyrrhocoris]KPA80936.1 hypothetical protein ABB37_04332 [Leptomonas pyrrhocoris]|eukprot:XP_015659375.1 hypothetical protein ABB37_04332 [Leptomonas pyrrhocoris]
MYSEDASTVSSRSGDSEELQHVAAEQTGAAKAMGESASSDEAPIVVESDDSYDEDADNVFHGAVQASTVPVACLERCAIFFDGARFDPRSQIGDDNERVVECSMAVVEYPFCRPTCEAPKTLIHTPALSVKKITKIQRAVTVQRWGQLIAAQHGIPCTAEGASTGYEELQRTVRTYDEVIQRYYHMVKDGSSKNNGSDGTATKGTSEMSVALSEADLYRTLPDMVWNTVVAAVNACRAERAHVEVAFLTTKKRYEEVCKCLLWLQTHAEVSFPPYQVFTVEEVLGEDWDALVTRERENCSCGYHNYLMTNNYGNRRHCCEGTVTAMLKVMQAAVRNL